MAAAAAANVTREELSYATINEENVSGYDFEIHGDKLDDYFCFICSSLLRNSAELPCHHLMCKGCLDKWIQ